MSENKFEKKLRGVFHDHEIPAGPAVWSGIADGLASSAGTAALTSSKLFKTIGAAVVMVGIGIGSTALYFTQKQVSVTSENIQEVGKNSEASANNKTSSISPSAPTSMAQNGNNMEATTHSVIEKMGTDDSQNLVASDNATNQIQTQDLSPKTNSSTPTHSATNEFKPGGTRTNCVGAEISFNPPSAPDDVSFLWNFGDGSFSNEREPKHHYLKPGTYVVSLSLSGHKSAQINTMNMSETITILTTPDADFDWTFVNGPNEAPTVQIENLSQRSHSTTWSFDDGKQLESDAPLKSFSEAGKHAVKITAINENGCKDTKIKYLDINSDYNLNAPGSIYVGQEFMPQGLTAMKGNFVLSIYDNGKKIFETKSPKRAWTGQDAKGRSLETEKQYPWIAIVHNEKTGEDKYYSGSILLRP